MDYGNSQTRSWTIIPECDTIYFQSSVFDLEEYFDYLSILSGSQNQTFTGSTIIDFSLSVSTMVQIRFTSDSSITKDGFILKWSCVSFYYNHIPLDARCPQGNEFSSHDQLSDHMIKPRSSQNSVMARQKSWPWLVQIHYSQDMQRLLRLWPQRPSFWNQYNHP